MRPRRPRAERYGALDRSTRGERAGPAHVYVPVDGDPSPDQFDHAERPRSGKEPVRAREHAAEREREDEPGVPRLQRVHEHHERDRACSECGEHRSSISTICSMDREQLRATQGPIKERYRREPEAALITLRADGTLDDDELACSVATGRELVKA